MYTVNVVFGSQGNAYWEEICDAAHLDQNDLDYSVINGDWDLDNMNSSDPHTREFETQAECDAYLQGLADMDGWMAYQTVTDDEVETYEHGKARLVSGIKEKNDIEEKNREAEKAEKAEEAS